MVRNFKERGGPGKLRSYLEDKIYVVTERKHKDSHVYAVKLERGAGKTRVLHGNLLQRCNFLPVKTETDVKNMMDRKNQRQDRNGRKQEQSIAQNRDSDSDDEDKWRFITHANFQIDQSGSQPREGAEEFQPEAVEEENVELQMSADEAVEHDSEGAVSSDEADERGPEPPPPITRQYRFRQRNLPKTLR